MITVDGDCGQEIKRLLLLGRKAMTNLDSILKSRDITLLIKVFIFKVMVFALDMYGSESWTIKKTEHQRTDAFELSGWRRLLIVPWTGRRSNQSVCCRKGDPFQGPKLSSCPTLRNELSEETHVLTKQDSLLGKGTRVESSKVRGPRRTVLSHGLQSWVLC